MSEIEIKFKGYDGYQVIRAMIGEYLNQALPIDGIMMEVAVNEAINNAIEHGNQGNSNRWVQVKLRGLAQSRVIVRVKDEGEGFRKQNLGEQIPCTRGDSGRGIFLMNQLTDRVVYNGKGNEVILSKVNRLYAKDNGYSEEPMADLVRVGGLL